MKDKLTLMIRQEIARLSLRSSPGVLIICVITFVSVFGLDKHQLLIRVCAVLSFVIVCLRMYFAKKINDDINDLPDWCWPGLRLSYLVNAVMWSFIYSTSVWEIKGFNPYYFVIFAMLAGFIANLLFSISMDQVLFISCQAVVLIPLILIAIFHSVNGDEGYSKFLLIAYFIYSIYLSLQYRLIRKQGLDRLRNSLELEENNQALTRTKFEKENFLNLILDLLSKDLPLKTVLETIVLCIEQFNISNLCSILLLNKEKTRFEMMVAPKLPTFFNEAIMTVDIGMGVGSCGTCAYTGERVIVEDIQTHPYWAPFRELATRAGLGSSWSEPIKDSKGKILGTFALYQHGPHAPTEKDIHLIKQAADVVGIVLQRYETEKDLAHTQNQLSLIYNNTIDAMWLIAIEDKKTFRFENINDAFVEVTGLKRHDVIGKTIEEVLPPSSHELVRTKYSEAMDTQKKIEYLEIAPLPSGTKTGLIRVVPIRNPQGEVSRLLGIAEDITEKKQMDDLIKEQENDLLYAQHVAHMGNWKWNIPKDEVIWSPEVYSIHNLDPKCSPPSFEKLGKLFVPESWEKLQNAVMATVTHGTPYKLDLELSKGNNARWVLARGEVLERDELGKVIRMVGTIQNITERKELENDLTGALKARDEFFLVASHELKTPLTTLELSLHGMTRLLTSDPSIGSEKLVAKLDMAKKQSERLEVLIKNLLDVSRMSTEGVQLQTFKEVDISKLIDEAGLKCEEELLRVGSTLTKDIQPDIICECDPVRIEQVITNLLTNAQKYGGGKPVDLRIRKLGTKIRIEVEDHGIGIPEDKLKQIFERFKRADDDHSYKGLGLGLWIVTEIINAHRGEVWVESEVGKGSTFIVELKQDLQA